MEPSSSPKYSKDSDASLISNQELISSYPEEKVEDLSCLTYFLNKNLANVVLLFLSPKTFLSIKT